MSEPLQSSPAPTGTGTPTPSPSPAPTPPQATTEPKPAAEPKTEEPKVEAKPSLLNEGDKPKEEKPAAEGAPEKYEAFTLPEGFEANEAVMTEAQGVFKELGLPQASAQKLVDLYAKVSQDATNAPFKLWEETQTKWVAEVKADKEIGGKLDQVRSTISKAIDGLGDTKLAQDFREAMDYTGAGNNPAFIRAFYKLAQKVTEGTGVKAGGPSAVKEPGSAPATAASRMYPNLPSGG